WLKSSLDDSKSSDEISTSDDKVEEPSTSENTPSSDISSGEDSDTSLDETEIPDWLKSSLDDSKSSDEISTSDDKVEEPSTSNDEPKQPSKKIVKDNTKQKSTDGDKVFSFDDSSFTTVGNEVDSIPDKKTDRNTKKKVKRKIDDDDFEEIKLDSSINIGNVSSNKEIKDKILKTSKPTKPKKLKTDNQNKNGDELWNDGMDIPDWLNKNED
ncbi:MAG: hypothetical protein PHN31_02085, partial [Candidatus Gracilibacteria bacterium]|nr:hypothetical protein [Candidatus Gracilibacteria bacterium]